MKFKIIKHFSLDFLGEDWKEAYINFKPLSIADVKEKLPIISKLQAQDADTGEGIDTLLTLLNEKFLEGKAIAEDGILTDLTANDINDLPIEVVGKAFTFLSATEAKTS